MEFALLWFKIRVVLFIIGALIGVVAIILGLIYNR